MSARHIGIKKRLISFPTSYRCSTSKTHLNGSEMLERSISRKCIYRASSMLPKLMQRKEHRVTEITNLLFGPPGERPTFQHPRVLTHSTHTYQVMLVYLRKSLCTLIKAPAPPSSLMSLIRISVCWHRRSNAAEGDLPSDTSIVKILTCHYVKLDRRTENRRVELFRH